MWHPGSQAQPMPSGAKNPANFESNMNDAFDGLNIPFTTAQKFGFEEAVDLKLKIKTDFNNLLSLK